MTRTITIIIICAILFAFYAGIIIRTSGLSGAISRPGITLIIISFVLVLTFGTSLYNKEYVWSVLAIIALLLLYPGSATSLLGILIPPLYFLYKVARFILQRAKL